MTELAADELAELERLEASLAESPAPKGSNLRGPKLPVQRRKTKARRDARRARRKNRRR